MDDIDKSKHIAASASGANANLKIKCTVSVDILLDYLSFVSESIFSLFVWQTTRKNKYFLRKHINQKYDY